MWFDTLYDSQNVQMFVICESYTELNKICQQANLLV